MMLVGGCIGATIWYLQIRRLGLQIEGNVEIDVEIARLTSADAKTRVEAACALARAGRRAAPAVPALIGALDDHEKVLFSSSRGLWPTTPADPARAALCRIGKPAVGPLLGALQADDAKAQVYAASALGDIADRRAVEPLIAALNDEDAAVQVSAMKALGNIRDRRAVEPLVAVLKSENPDLRSRAAVSLGKIKDRRAANPLIALLMDENLRVRLTAIHALRDIKYSGAVEPLIALLKDDTTSVRVAAAEALGTIGDRRAVRPLVAALHDDNRVLRLVTTGALTKITRQDFGQDVAAWQQWLEPQ